MSIWKEAVNLVCKVLYIVFAISFISIFCEYSSSKPYFFPFAGDYLAYRATAEIAESVGYAKVYDMHVQRKFQRKIIRSINGPDKTYAKHQVLPVVYPPFFVLFLRLILLFSPLGGLAAFIGVNLLITGASVLLVIGLGLNEDKMPLRSTRVLIYAPLLFAFIWAQITPWLMLFAAGFLSSAEKGKPVLSGIWLSGMLLKPQLVVLVVVGLVVSKNWKILKGFFIGGSLIALVSIVLVGPKGCVDMAAIVFDMAEGLHATSPMYQVSWRTVGLHLEKVVPWGLAWAICFFGMAAVVALSLIPWKNFKEGDFDHFVVLVLLSFTGAFLTGWHVHSHSIIPALPFLMYLENSGKISSAVVDLWILVPSIVLCSVFFGWPAVLLSSFSVFLMNLFLLTVLVRKANKKN